MNIISGKIKGLISLCLALCLIFSGAPKGNVRIGENFDTVPVIKETEGFITPIGTGSSEGDGVNVGSRFFELIFGKNRDGQSKKDIYLCPGGDAFGVKICGSGVTVSKIVTQNENCVLMKDDRILAIGSKEVSSIAEVRSALSNSGGKPQEFEILRAGKRITVTVTPTLVGGEYHIGAILHDGASGIGTVTYYDPSTLSFGGLGHGITDKDTKDVLKMTRGTVTGVILAGAHRGEPQHPGELRGVLTDKTLGTLDSNTECGVFGTLSPEAIKSPTEPIPIGRRDEVECGSAKIISTIKSGKKAEYKIEITDVERDSLGTKCFKIKVTDDALIALTGGIVRGMSGSPIIQNGKLVGAVTHVMVANPTEGYGIFIENMLSAANNEVIPKAA